MQYPDRNRSVPSKTSHYGYFGFRGGIRRLFLTFVFLPFLTHLNISASQTQDSYPVMIPIPHPITSLLRAQEIRHELGMSRVQIRDVEEAIDDVDLPLWRLRDVPFQERNGSAGLLIHKLKQNLTQILSTEQMERLNQLTRQAKGIAAVLEPEMKLRLGLSAEQIDNIRLFLNATYEKLAELQGNTERSSESRRAASIRKLRDGTERKILTVLNGLQKRTLRKLMGIPFDLSRVRIIACKAPELEVDTWIHPLETALPELEGKVTVIHFYAFGCGNCIRTLPYYNQWREHFPASLFQIIGIHRPETERERDIEKVKEKAMEAGMEYPIAIDNESLMWDAWANRIWPSIYLIDKNGYVRYWWYGELNWQGAESEKYLRAKIQVLLEESVIGNAD